MNPVLFRIDLPRFIASLTGVEKVTVYTYALCVIVGALLAAVYIRYVSGKQLRKKIPVSFFYMAFTSGFIGGKLFFFLEKPQYYLTNPAEFFENPGGFVVYGSIFFVAAFTLVYTRVTQRGVLKVLDIVATGSLIPMALGRVGCFLGGCCYGKPTGMFTAVCYPTAEGNLLVHPVQLYDTAALLIIFGVLHQIGTRKRFNGQVFLSFLTMYAVSRFLTEFLRGDFRGTFLNGGVSHAQAIAIVTAVLALIFYKLVHKNIFSNQ